MKCEYCDNEFETKLSLKGHKAKCPFNPNVKNTKYTKLENLKENYFIKDKNLYLPLLRNSGDSIPCVYGFQIFYNVSCPSCKNTRYIIKRHESKIRENLLCKKCSLKKEANIRKEEEKTIITYK